MTTKALGPHPGKRRYLALFFPWLPAERLCRTAPRPPDAPLVFAEKQRGALRIASVDAHAQAVGLSAGMPLAVKYVGWAHGGLFLLFLLALGQADWRLVALAALINVTLNTAARVGRWSALLGALPRASAAPGFVELCLLYLASQAASNLLPARAGEALRRGSPVGCGL